MGLLVGVYGVGYLIAATDPFRHWPIVFVGLLGKILGPIGFLVSAFRGELPWSWGITILTNDVVWWAPFAAILYLTFKSHSDTSTGSKALETAVSSVQSHRGATLRELSSDRPLLLLFLRHTGCTFCREALADLAAVRDQIEDAGTRIAVVHMSPLLRATQMFISYGLEDLHRFSDPECELYRAFGLTRGTLKELVGPSVWSRGLGAIVRGHGLGPLEGDGFRMPGLFLLRDGRVVQSYRHRSSSDRPNYVAFANGTMASRDSLNAHTTDPRSETLVEK